MKSLCPLLLLSLTTISPLIGRSQGDSSLLLEKLDNAYQKQVAEIRKPLDELDQLYEKRLKSIQEDRQKRGDLEQTLALKKEIETFRDNTKEDIPENFQQLRDARAVYLRELSRREPVYRRRMDEFQRKHRDRMLELQSNLTREGDLESALQVKARIDEWEKTNASDPAQAGPVKIELFWERNFKGESVFLEVPCQVNRFGFAPELKNDRLKSIRIPDGVTVTVATGAALEGEQETLDDDENSIRLEGISSLKAERTP